MPNLVNKLVTEEYQRELESAEGLIVVSVGGLSVAEVETLRVALAEKGVRLRMIRNSLATRAFRAAGYDVGDDVFSGNVAVAFGDAAAAVGAAKVFSTPEVKKAGKVQIRAGVLERSLLGAADAAALADVPDQDTLRSRLIGCIQGPLRGLAAVINAPMASLARVLQARVDAGPAPAAEPEPAAAPAAEAPAETASESDASQPEGEAP